MEFCTTCRRPRGRGSAVCFALEKGGVRGKLRGEKSGRRDRTARLHCDRPRTRRGLGARVRAATVINGAVHGPTDRKIPSSFLLTGRVREQIPEYEQSLHAQPGLRREPTWR